MPRRKLPRDVDAEPALRTVEETAVLLGVSVAQIYRFARRGELEMIKIGRSTRVTQASLDSYIAKRPVPK